MTDLRERFLLKRYASFRSQIARWQWILLFLMALFVSGAAILGLSISFVLMSLLVFFSGCIGASLSLLREFRQATAATLDPFKISQIGTDTQVVTGGVLALVFLLILSAGFVGGTGENGGNQTHAPFIELPGLPVLGDLSAKLGDADVSTGEGDENADVRKEDREIGDVLSPRKLFTEGILDFRNLSVLLLWSLLAGYSEGLVFGLLKRFSAKMTKDE